MQPCTLLAIDNGRASARLASYSARDGGTRRPHEGNGANMVKRHQLRQRPFRGGRLPIPGAFDPRIEAAIMETVARFNVSRQMVLSEACADYFGIDLEDADRCGRASKARKDAPRMIDPEASALYRAFWEKTTAPVTVRQAASATKRAKGGR